ncbi:MAG TPA: hypothetical protein VJX67_17975 [Blastocatellia bacterium]|nr:hypothetical protein [Blastocatellia bacterium]
MDRLIQHACYWIRSLAKIPAATAVIALGLGFTTNAVRSDTISARRPRDASASIFRLDSLSGLEVINTKPEVVTYRGRRSLHLNALPGHEEGEEVLAIVQPSGFADGTIEVEVAGAPRSGAPGYARGFIGIAFRVQPHGSQFECFYVRPTNGRADDQVRRNHSTQYISHPNYPWERLRTETPGAYESYVDLEPGAWTKMKIVVAGTHASLYVNESTQPCLIVNDLKLGESTGQVALWATSETDAHFSNLVIK